LQAAVGGDVGVGGAELAAEAARLGLIDEYRLFVHPVAVGQGVAATLIDALEKLAAARGASALTVDASDTAHGFFLHRGYADQRRNSVAIGDEWLASTTMSKTLVTRTPGTGPVSDSPS
jgi:GNAT superfamily N-acetyltransferase